MLVTVMFLTAASNSRQYHPAPCVAIFSRTSRSKLFYHHCCIGSSLVIDVNHLLFFHHHRQVECHLVAELGVYFSLNAAVLFMLFSSSVLCYWAVAIMLLNTTPTGYRQLHTWTVV
jgi:hypothetical protein